MRVVDASALVTLVAGSDQATRDELGTKLTGHELHVPEHNGAEVLSAIRGLRLGGKISEAIAIQALADYAAMPLRPHRAAPFFPRAWQLRHAMTAYDALYASLAETLDCPLVTCDEKLRAGGHGAEVLVVGLLPRLVGTYNGQARDRGHPWGVAGDDEAAQGGRWGSTRRKGLGLQWLRSSGPG